MKHTKGAWNWDERPFYNEKDKQFASIVFAEGTADEPSGADCCPDDFSPALVFGKTKEECEANAKLIAAAPEMLKALQDVADPSKDPLETMDNIEKAIKKATL